MEITQKLLQEWFDYNSATGMFVWKISRGNQYTNPGMLAGFKDTYGHMGIEISGKRYLSHRLAWMYVYGEWPKNDIDHINGIKDDNRLCNLRDVTKSINNMNRKVHANNKLGIKGVSQQGKKFQAIIINNKKHTYLGSYDTIEQAQEAYLKANLIRHLQ